MSRLTLLYLILWQALSVAAQTCAPITGLVGQLYTYEVSITLKEDAYIVFKRASGTCAGCGEIIYEITYRSGQDLVIKPPTGQFNNALNVKPSSVSGQHERFSITARYSNTNNLYCQDTNVAQTVDDYRVEYKNLKCNSFDILDFDAPDFQVTPGTTFESRTYDAWQVTQGCGALSYSFTFFKIPDGVDANIARNYFSLEVRGEFLFVVANPPLEAIPGGYQLQVTGSFETGVRKTRLVTVAIRTCSFSFEPRSLNLKIGVIQPVTQTYNQVDVKYQPADCRYTFKFQVTSSLPGFVTANYGINYSSLTINAQTEDRSLYQSHQKTIVEVTVVANENNYLDPVTRFLTLNLIDPCLSTVLLSSQQLKLMKISALSFNPETQQVLAVKDTISLQYGDKSGFKFCPDRTYTVSSSSPLPAGSLSIDQNGLITVDARTITHSYLGRYQITVQVAFLTLSTKLFKFDLVIEKCIVTGLSLSTPLNQFRSYTIGDVAQTWESFVTMSPLCPYTLDFSFENLPNCVTVVTSQLKTTLTVESFVRGDAIDRQVQVTAAVREQPDMLIVDQFRLKIIDPCLTTVISDYVKTELVAFQGYQTQSQSKLNLTDNVSVKFSQLNPKVVDFCGPLSVSYKCNGTETDVVSGSNFDLITFSPTIDTIPGQADCEIKVTMPEVVHVVKTIGFTATTMGYVVQPIPDQIYQVGSQLLIPYTQFQIYPDTYSVRSDYHLYQVDDTGKLVSPLDLKELAPINEEHFTLDQNKRTIKIQIKELNFPTASFINVVLVAVVKNTIVLWTNFKVTVIKNAESLSQFSYNKAPVWQSSFGNFQVNQCDSKPTVSWFFDLPGLQDMEGDDILEPKVVFQSQAISYDPISRRFKQQIYVGIPTNVTVEIVVEDSRGASATHKFQVHFRCYFNQSLALSKTESEQESITQQSVKLTATIERIYPDGKMTIRFDQIMTVPAAASELQNATITLNSTLYPALNIRLLPGLYSSVESHDVNWTLVNFTTSRLVVQLHFQQPAIISSVIGSKDLLVVKFYGYSWFRDQQGNFIMPGYELNSRSLPMLGTMQEVQAAKEIGSIAQMGASSLLGASTLINLLMTGPLQQILGTVRFSQVLMHLLLIDMPIPATISAFFSEFMSLLTWQLLDLTKFFDSMFKLDQVDALTDQFNLFGYQSLYIVQNLGTIAITIVAPLIFWLVTYLVARFVYPKLRVRSEKLTKMLFFDKTLQFIDETYLILTICAALNLHYYRWDSWGNTSNILITFATLIVVVAFPLIVALMYSTKRNLALIRDREQTGKSFMDRFGSLVRPLHTHRRGAAVVSQLYFDKLRKLWLVYILVFMQANVYLSLLMANYQALMMSIIVGHLRPYTEQRHTRMELFNEFTALVVIYHLTLFTDYVPQVQIREYIGRSLCVVICGNMAVNLQQIFSKSLVLFYTKMKLRYTKWQQMKKQKQTEKQKRISNKSELMVLKIEREIELEVAKQAQKEQVQAEIQLLSSISERAQESSPSERQYIAAKPANTQLLSWSQHQQLKPESLEAFERNQPTLPSYVPPTAAIVQFSKNQRQQVQSQLLSSSAVVQSGNPNNRFVFAPRPVISEPIKPQQQQLEQPSLLDAAQTPQKEQNSVKDQITQDLQIGKQSVASLQEYFKARFKSIEQKSREQHQIQISQENRSSGEPPAWHKQKKFPFM